MSHRLITRICFGLLLLMTAAGCTEDLAPAPAPEEQQPGLPVCFTAAWPQDEADTRAVTDKTTFRDGDVMHVSATFTLDKTNAAEKKLTKYATLVLSNGEWVNQTGSGEAASLDMSWPWNAKTGTFTAYYTRVWNGPIEDKGKELAPISLDRLAYAKDTLDADPLQAIVEDVPYGHAVHLPFHHLCTRLTLTHVDNEDEYWLTFKAPESKLLNACTMQRNADNTLDFKFTQTFTQINAGTGTNANMVKVASHVDVASDGTRSVTFNLAPDDYSTFTLTRRNGYAYITLSGIQMEKTEGGNTVFKLEAGKAYTLSLKDLSGFITQDDADSDWWEEGEPENPYKGFDVQDFMNAIAKCETYNCTLDGQDVTLLQADPYKKEVKLMGDVDFGGTKFNAVELDNTITFDGGNRTILGVNYPMFNHLSGIVTQLRLMNVNVTHHEADPEAAKEPGHDTAWGALARICNGGRIYRVNLTKANMDVTLHTSDQDEMYNVGALVGIMEAGVISELSLMDDITVNVTSPRDDATYATGVGGVVGQCSGILHEINHTNSSTGDDLAKTPAIRVTNQCKGSSTRYTGGIVGLLANGTLDHCMVHTVVDASQALGTWNYAGGVVGVARGAEGKPAKIISPTVTGSVAGGDASSTLAKDVHTSVGGIVAHVNQASVTGSTSYSKIQKMTFSTPGTNYIIGGVMGSVKEPGTIEGNEGRSGFNTEEYTDSKYIVGRFAGSSTVTEEVLMSTNSADGDGKFLGILHMINNNIPEEEEKK